MALASQLKPLPSSAPPPTMEGFAFVQIGKPPTLLSRLGDGSAALDASSEGSSDQSLADDDDMYAPEDPQAPPADIQMQDAFASNPGAPGSRSLLSRMDPSAIAPLAAPADNVLPTPTPDAPASSTAADISVADQQPPSQVVPGPPAPPVASSSNAGQTIPEPQAPAELSAIRSLFSSLTAFKIPIPDGIAQLVHTLTTETTSVSTSAHKAVASAQEALKCAQKSLEAAQASLASAGSLEAKCREVTDALERLSKENALKKQAWDKTMKETVRKGEEWVEVKEKEDAELQQKQQLLREQNDKLANAARHFKKLATEQPPAIVTNGQSDSSAIHYPAHMPSPVREKVEAFAKQQLQAYQDEEQAKYLEKEKDLEDLLRKHQEEVERLASEREQLRKQREQSRLRISGQGEGGSTSADKGKGTSSTASQSPSAQSQHALTSPIAGGTQHSLAAASSVASQPAAHNIKASQPSGTVAPVTKPLVSKNDTAQHEASLRKKLKVRTSLGGDRHDNKSMSNSPVSPAGAAFLYPDSASASPQAEILASPTTNGPQVASSGTAALVAEPSLAHRPVLPSLPATPVTAIDASQTRQPVLGMPTPLPSPNASLEAIKAVAMAQPPSPTDSTLGKTLSKRQAKKMRKASQQSLGSDSSQMTVNHHGSDAGNLSLQPSPTLPTVPFIQELSARRSSAECLKERASVKSEPMEASLPKEGSTQPNSKVKAEPQASPVVPPREAGQAPAGAGARLPSANSTTEATDPLPALPTRRKAASQPQAKAAASSQIVPFASQPAAIAAPAQSIVLAEPARPSPTSGPLSSERPAGVPYPNHQSGGQHSVQRGPPSRGRPDGGRSHIRSDSRRQRDTWQPVGDGSYTRPSHDHWSPPPYVYRQSSPRRDVRDYDHRGARSRSPGSAHISRKRSLDEYDSAAMMRNARRPRYDDEPPVAYSSSGGTIATMGDHDIDMNDLPPRPPMRNPRSRNPSGEHRSWHTGGADYAGSSSALRPSLENRIEQADAPRPAHFMDRLADAPMAESLVQDQVEFHHRTHSPASEQGDRAPLKYRLSNPSRGRGAKRGGRGGGRGGGYGGKDLASRIRLDTPNDDYERE